MPIEPLKISDLQHRAENIYKAVSAIGVRADQIGEDRRSDQEEKLAPFRAKIKESGLEYDIDRVYPEQVLITLRYETMKKPVLVSLKDYLEGKYDIQNEDVKNGKHKQELNGSKN